MEVQCVNCGQVYESILASCGAGYTWSLYKCPHCGQLVATGDIIPDFVKHDEDIIVLDTLRPEPPKIINGAMYILPAKGGENNVLFGYRSNVSFQTQAAKCSNCGEIIGFANVSPVNYCSRCAAEQQAKHQ